MTAEDNGNQKKYLGVCKLPGENRRVSRRITIVTGKKNNRLGQDYFTYKEVVSSGTVGIPDFIYIERSPPTGEYVEILHVRCSAGIIQPIS